MDGKKCQIGFYSFTGCQGEYVTLVHCEDQILDLFSAANVKSFLVAQSDNDDTELDVAFLEGSITTEEEKKRLLEIGGRSDKLVALGTCAMYGGIQAMRNGDQTWNERFKKVYGDTDITVAESFESKPVSDFVKIDAQIPGCPTDEQQLIRGIAKLVKGTDPNPYDLPVCVECRFRGNECLLLKGIFCLGPLTNAGCRAACPTYNLPCVGCFGPVKEANVASEYELLEEKGFSKEEIFRKVRNFGGEGMAELINKLEV